MHPKLYNKDKIHNNQDIFRPSILLSISRVYLLIRTIHFLPLISAAISN